MTTRIGLTLTTGLVCALMLGLSPSAVGAYSVEPITWDTIGLDSNSPAFGPNTFPVGAKICGGTAGTSAEIKFEWLTGGTDTGAISGCGTGYSSHCIDLVPGSAGSPSPGAPALTVDFAADGSDGGCRDAYFQVEVDKDSGAFDKARRYRIYVDGTSDATPTPRELYVEHLVSQGRNYIQDLQFGTSIATLQSVAAGGSFTLVKGGTYFIRLVCATATQGYEQLETFTTLPNTVFKILSVADTYTADTSSFVNPPYDKLYANACNWDADPNSPYYRSCLGEGKVGGNITVTYQVQILGIGSGSQSINSLIHDFSGSSFHYNSDYLSGGRTILLVDPAAVTFTKSFAPNPTNAGGISTLTFSLYNPGGGAVTGVNFSDPLPIEPVSSAQMMVAATPNASYSGCGTPTFAPASGDTTLSFSNGTIAAGGTCTVKVNVTPPATGTYNNTSGPLSVEGVNTGRTASASLTVNTAPPAPGPVCGLTLADWSVPVGSPNPPVPTSVPSDVLTASASALVSTRTAIATSGSGDTTSWSVYGFKTAGLQAITFTVDTRKYTSIQLGFDMANTSPSNGPTSVVLQSSKDNGTTWDNIITISNPAAAFTTHIYNIPSASTTGNTMVRLTASGANTDASSGNLLLDNINFYGCGLPLPPTISKSFTNSPVAVTGTSPLTFSIGNPNPSIPLSNVSFTDTLPTGLTIASATSPQCGGTLTATAPNSISFSGGTLAAGASCTITTGNVTATTGGPHLNVSGFVSGQNSGNTYTNTGATGVATADLLALLPPVISKNFGPASALPADQPPFFPGTVFKLTFTISNPNSAEPLTGVTFSDTFPSIALGAPGNMTVAATPAATTSGCGTPIFAPSTGDGSISFSDGTIAAAGTCTVSVNVITSASGTYTNTSDNVTHTLFGTGTGNSASDSVLIETVTPGIALVKEVGPSATGPWTSFLATTAGSTIYYHYTVENYGDVALTGVTVTDGNPILANPVCSLGAVPAPALGSEAHIAECVSSGFTAVAGSFNYAATVTGTYSGTPYSDTSAARYATASLSIVKNAAESVFSADGETLHYSYLVTNNGFASLSGTVTVNDNKSSDEACPGINTVGDFDNYLDPGEALTCTATYVVQSDDVTAKEVTNTASASLSGFISPNASKTVKLAADLSISKTNDTGGSTTIGGSFTWTLTVSNATTSGATATFAESALILKDELPTGVATYALPTATATNAGGTSGTVSCAIASDVLTCSASGAPGVSIPPGGSFSIAVTVDVTGMANLVNPRSGGLCKVDPDDLVAERAIASNDCADTVTLPLPSITVLKSYQVVYDPINGAGIGNAKAIPGAEVLYTITVTNSGNGAVDTDTTVLSDPIPSGTELFVGDLGGAGSGPINFSQGTTASGLTYSYTSLNDNGDSLFFSGNNGTSYDKLDVDDATSYDPSVTNLRLAPAGAFSASDGTNHPSFNVQFKVRIK